MDCFFLRTTRKHVVLSFVAGADWMARELQDIELHQDESSQAMTDEEFARARRQMREDAQRYFFCVRVLFLVAIGCVLGLMITALVFWS
jgi:hypothetical protein